MDGQLPSMQVEWLGSVSSSHTVGRQVEVTASSASTTCTIFGTRLVEGYWGNEEIDMKAKEDESGKGMMQRVREGLEEEEF